MKVAFTTSGDSLEAPLDSRFGRAPKILVYDLDRQTFEITDNTQNLNAAQGAGIQAAQNVARTGATHLVPALRPQGLQCSPPLAHRVHHGSATVSEAHGVPLGRLNQGHLRGREGHW